MLRSDLRGDQAPVLAAVGPMQFEVAAHRMKGEMGAEITLAITGAHIIRTHDVGACVEALKLADIAAG